jgi:hypothetical protein
MSPDELQRALSETEEGGDVVSESQVEELFADSQSEERPGTSNSQSPAALSPSSASTASLAPTPVPLMAPPFRLPSESPITSKRPSLALARPPRPAPSVPRWPLTQARGHLWRRSLS